MKKLFAYPGIIIVTLSLFSCENRKEHKEWKKKEGRYVSKVAYQLYQDSTWNIDLSEIDVVPSGLSGRGKEVVTINFSVYLKSENPNSSYEYKCEYSSLSAYTFQNGDFSNAFIDKNKFTQKREFYVSFSGNTLTFTVINPSGEIDDIVFTRQ